MKSMLWEFWISSRSKKPKYMKRFGFFTSEVTDHNSEFIKLTIDKIK